MSNPIESLSEWPQPVAHLLNQQRNANLVMVATTLEGLLKARALVFQLHQWGYSGQCTVLGPAGVGAFFEMDSWHSPWVELTEVLPEQPSGWWVNWRGQAALSRWVQRQQAQAVVLFDEDQPYTHLFVRLANRGVQVFLPQSKPIESPSTVHQWNSSLVDVTDQKLPVLQAGPTALARATAHYQNVSAQAFKLLLVLDLNGVEMDLDALMQRVNVALGRQTKQLYPPQQAVVVTPLVYRPLSRMIRREAQKHWPTAVFCGPAELLGHVVYADRVMTNNREIPLLGHALGRVTTDLL